MEFKKTILSDYAAMMKEIIRDYRDEYMRIVHDAQKRDGGAVPEELPSIAPEAVEENGAEQENLQNTVVTSKDECVNKMEFDYKKFSGPDRSFSICYDDNQGGSNIENTYPQENKDICDNKRGLVCRNQFPDNAGTSRCVIQVQQNTHNMGPSYPENMTLLESSFNCATESFMTSEFRRRARRRTGRMVAKRKYETIDDHEDIVKKRRTDPVPNYLPQYLDIMSSKSRYNQEIEDLKAKLRAAECKEDITAEKEELKRMRKENIEVSLQIKKEVDSLQQFKEMVLMEMKKIEKVKTQLEVEKERIYEERLKNEKQQLEEQYRRETLKYDEERHKMEELRLVELRRAEDEKRKIELEKYKEIKRIMEEKTKLEQLLAEQNEKLERERCLYNQERERMNQTFLEMGGRGNETIKPKEVNIQLPIAAKIEVEKRDTLFQGVKKGVNELFKAAKSEFEEKVNQSVMAGVEKSSIEIALKPKTKDIDRIDAHFLYKKSIDVQIPTLDPKKFVPKTLVPFYQNEDEFENEDKKFAPALFTKDPKLNYIVKNQNHDEIRKFFGTQKEIDVEKVFNQIENVSNFSPNKLKTK